GEFRPADRLHLGGCVEFHRAGTERDHAAVERVVHVGELAQVAHHRGLRVVTTEHLVGEVLLVPGECRGDRGARLEGEFTTGNAERCDDRCQIVRGRGLVAGDAYVVGVDQSDVDATFPGGAVDPFGTRGHAGQHRVEERAVHDLDPTGTQCVGQFA